MDFVNLDLRQQLSPRRYVSGETFLYLGEPCILKVEDGLSPGVQLQDGILHVRMSLVPSRSAADRMVEKLLGMWYKARAAEELPKRIALYAPGLGVEPKAVRVKDLRSRWGSCSSRGSISFTWQIIMAPLSIVDYLIVHELCHLVHLNHSSSFWKLVERVFPDYRKRREWLKANGRLLQ